MNGDDAHLRADHYFRFDKLTLPEGMTDDTLLAAVRAIQAWEEVDESATDLAVKLWTLFRLLPDKR